MNAAHLEGELKAEVIAAPERFVVLDEELPLTLLDRKHAGKMLLLVTNSEWEYTRAMMTTASTLPAARHDLARAVRRGDRAEPASRASSRRRRRCIRWSRTAACCARASARCSRAAPITAGTRGWSKKHLGLAGDEILYVGDHVYADVHVSSQIRRWRTALVLRELEHEIAAERAFRRARARSSDDGREAGARARASTAAAVACSARSSATPSRTCADRRCARERLRALRAQQTELDARIAPLAQAAGELGNRAGAR